MSRVGRFNTGPRFFEGPVANNPTNNHLLIQGTIKKENDLLGVDDDEAKIVFRHNIKQKRRIVEPARAASIVDRKVQQRIDQLQSTLQDHAQQSARLDRELNRVLKLSQRDDVVLVDPHSAPRSAPASAARRRQQQQQQQDPLPLVGQRGGRQRRALSTAERKKKVTQGRAAALRRLRAKALMKGKTIPTSSKEAVKARNLRTQTKNLEYGF